MGAPPTLLIFVVGAVVGAAMTTGRRMRKARKMRSGRDERRHRVVRVGLEVARDEDWKVFAGRTVGLVTNHTGVMPTTLEHAVDVMHAAGVNLRAIFGPEHGFRGDAQAGSSSATSSSSRRQHAGVAAGSGSAEGSAVGSESAAGSRSGSGSSTDPRTGLPVYDTYRKSGAALTAVLSSAGVDTIAFDIQDVGARFYTVSARYDTVAAAAAVPPIAVVVLDRPNPLGGEAVEGPVTVEDACASFVGRKSIAVRHGMTVGELAWFFNKRFVPNDPNNATGKQPVKLVVVPMRGWRRHMSWDQTGLPWVPPSPNVPTATTAMAYVGTCLLEGTNCSEGRGTALPFELVGATWADGSLVDAMRGRHRSVDSGGGGAGEGDARGGGGGGDGIEGVSYGQMVSGGGGGGGIDGVEEANRDDKKGGRFASGGSRASKGKTPAIAPACTYREAYFTPTSGAHQGEFVTGVQVFPLGIDRSLFREGVALLAAMKRLYPGSFRWREEEAAGGASSSSRLKAARRRAESAAVFMSPSKLSSRQDQDRGHAEGGPPFFIDLLTGSGRLREALDGAAGDGAGARVVEELFASWEDELRTFVELRRGFLLYD